MNGRNMEGGKSKGGGGRGGQGGRELWSSKLVNHQIRHQATYKVGCQPDDCI